MSPLEKLGIAIKAARIKTDMTQSDLAQYLNVSPHHLGSIENGHQKPSYDLLCSLVDRLDIPIDDIFNSDSAHGREELGEMIAMLHNCDDKELAVISAALHAIMKFK